MTLLLNPLHIWDPLPVFDILRCIVVFFDSKYFGTLTRGDGVHTVFRKAWAENAVVVYGGALC